MAAKWLFQLWSFPTCGQVGHRVDSNKIVFAEVHRWTPLVKLLPRSTHGKHERTQHSGAVAQCRWHNVFVNTLGYCVKINVAVEALDDTATNHGEEVELLHYAATEE